MFDLDRFVADCLAALGEGSPRHAVQDVVARAMDDRAGIVRALGVPTKAGMTPLHHSPQLTILHVVWGPGMVMYAHDHAMWGVAGLIDGREDNILWRRVADDPAGHIEARGAKALTPGDVLSLGADAIHSVVNPLDRLSASLHIYGGDFFCRHSSEWHPDDLAERPFDIERAKAQFADANARMERRILEPA